MVYLFNLPDPLSKKAGGSGGGSGGGSSATTGASSQAAAQAAPAAAAGGGSGGQPRSTSAALAGEAAALMVSDVPDWEPLGSQINRRYTQELLSLLPEQHRVNQHQLVQDPAREAGTSSTAPQKQDEPPAAAALPAAAGPGPGPGATAVPPGLVANELAFINSFAAATSAQGQAEGVEPPAAAGTVKHTLQAVDAGESVLGVLLSWMKERARWADAGRYEPFASTITRRHHQRPTRSKQGPQPQQQQQQPSWGAKCHTAAQLLQDEGCLQELQVLERYRFSFDGGATPARVAAAMQWPAVVDDLRAAAAGQWALLGALGQQAAEQQWQRQQSEGDTDRDTAVARAVYLLLLLRLLGPITAPSIRKGARVIVLR